MEIEVVESCVATTAMTVKKMMAPTKSSKAAIGINVFVTGPSVLNSLTIDKEGAGAVARAIPPNRNAR